MAGTLLVARHAPDQRRLGLLLTGIGGSVTGVAAVVGFFMMAPYPTRWVVGHPAYFLLPAMVAIGILVLVVGLYFTRRLWGAAGLLALTGALALATGVFPRAYMYSATGVDDGVAYQPSWMFAVGAFLVIASLPLAMITPKPRET